MQLSASDLQGKTIVGHTKARIAPVGRGRRVRSAASNAEVGEPVCLPFGQTTLLRLGKGDAKDESGDEAEEADATVTAKRDEADGGEAAAEAEAEERGDAGGAGGTAPNANGLQSSASQQLMHPSKPPSTAVTTTSTFECSTQSYESSNATSSSGYTQTTDESYDIADPLRDGAVNKQTTYTEQPNGAGDGRRHDSSGDSKRRSRSALESSAALFPESNTELGIFYNDILIAIQRWFTVFGWPNGQFPIAVPFTLRSSLSRVQAVDEEQYKIKVASGATWDTGGGGSSKKKERRTFYDMIANLCGRSIPGISVNSPLPSDPELRAKQVHWQHAMLLTFLKNQGASLAHVRPEHLMEPKDYKVWIRLERRGDVAPSSPHHRRRSAVGMAMTGTSEAFAAATTTPVWSSARHNRRAQLAARHVTEDSVLVAPVALAHTPSALGVGGGTEDELGALGETDSSYALPSADDAGSSGGAPHAASSVLAELGTSASRSSVLVDLEHHFFESISKQAWIDVLLQILKTLVVSRVTPKTYRHLQLPPDLVAECKQLPALNQDLFVSNIYSINERILLIWLNFFYEHYRTRIWSNTRNIQGLAPKGKGTSTELNLNSELNCLHGTEQYT